MSIFRCYKLLNAIASLVIATQFLGSSAAFADRLSFRDFSFTVEKPWSITRETIENSVAYFMEHPSLDTITVLELPHNIQPKPFFEQTLSDLKDGIVAGCGVCLPIDLGIQRKSFALSNIRGEKYTTQLRVAIPRSNEDFDMQLDLYWISNDVQMTLISVLHYVNPGQPNPTLEILNTIRLIN